LQRGEVDTARKTALGAFHGVGGLSIGEDLLFSSMFYAVAFVKRDGMHRACGLPLVRVELMGARAVRQGVARRVEQ
jgi:hypothetical protein